MNRHVVYRSVSLTYLDQNAVIELGRMARAPDFRKKLDTALESGSLNVVVASWHLIETARTTNLANAEELANFIDSLKPSWLFERRNIQKLDIEDDFYKFLKIEHPSAARVTTRSAVFAELNHQNDDPKFDIPSAVFVRQWIQHPEQLKVLEETYKTNAATLIRLRELAKAGKITDEIRSRVNEIMVKMSLPKTTPAGLIVGHDTTIDYVSQVKGDTIPSFAIETAISEHEWISQGGVDGNTLIDKFHIISALPYVDEIVSKDKFFHKVYPAVVKTGHVRAKLLYNDEFFERF